MAGTVGPIDDPETARQIAHIDFEVLRSRLLERKREAIARIRARKVTEDKTCINLWRRRRAWLARAESEQEASKVSTCVIEDSD